MQCCWGRGTEVVDKAPRLNIREEFFEKGEGIAVEEVMVYIPWQIQLVNLQLWDFILAYCLP